MRLRTLSLAAALTAGFVATSSAVVAPRGADAPYVAAGAAPRLHRDVTYVQPGQMAARGLSGYTAILDRDTGVPLRMWGHGIVASGSIADGAIAEAAARQYLAEHLATLAPGSQASDFELVSNVLGGVKQDIRSIGFQQRAGGVKVLGGTVSFAFKRDRLVLVGSTALPNVVLPASGARVAHTSITAAAVDWLARDGFTIVVDEPAALVAPERVIVPTVRPRTAMGLDITYQLAEPLTAHETNGPGKWDVWVDATTGAAIARQSKLHFASGTILYTVPQRAPAYGPRVSYPAALASQAVSSGGAAATAVTSALDGSITWAGDGVVSVGLRTTGPLVRVKDASNTLATSTMTLAPGGTVTWDQGTLEAADAQLATFIHANVAKQFALTHLNPSAQTSAFLNSQLEADVNEADTCNAFWDEQKLNFFQKGGGCENTGRMADVVYHEYGHAQHQNSEIAGVGNWMGDAGGLTEGVADIYSLLITRDAGLGRGFFLDQRALRDLNPATDLKYPDNISPDPHATGEIIGEAFYDLQQALISKLGAEAGYAESVAIYYSTIQRATDIPSAYAEALLVDDDDGDLANGTPNQCTIETEYGKHGMYSATSAFTTSLPTRDAFKIAVAPSAASSRCGGPTLAAAAIEWKVRGGTVARIAMTNTADTYTGDIPTQPDGSVVQYRVILTLSDSSTVSLPDNQADPFYEFYVGAVDEIYCTSFEGGMEGWTPGGVQNDWEAAPPRGLGGDPRTAYDGSNVLGMDLTADGVYDPQRSSFVESPAIDLMGNTNVRLQYYRWLGTEDGFYEDATIKANGTAVWSAYASNTDPQQGEVNHVDREWRFQDVDLSAQAAAAADGTMKLRFEHTSDQALEFGGWTMDKVCLVTAKGPAVTCGNNTVDDGETCDDGNRIDGDGCSANCATESDPMNPDGKGDDTGCCSANPGAASGSLLAFLTLGALFMGADRKRRRRS